MNHDSAPKSQFYDSAKMVMWGVLWIVGACWFWYYLVGNPFDEFALIHRGQTTPGSIIDTWEEVEDDTFGRAVWFHGATYTYRLPDGREFTQRSQVRSGRLGEEFRNLTEPYPVEIEYLPENPSVSRIKGDGHDSLWSWLLLKVGLGSLLLAVFVSPGLILLRNVARNIKRLRASSV